MNNNKNNFALFVFMICVISIHKELISYSIIMNAKGEPDSSRTTVHRGEAVNNWGRVVPVECDDHEAIVLSCPAQGNR